MKVKISAIAAFISIVMLLAACDSTTTPTPGTSDNTNTNTNTNQQPSGNTNPGGGSSGNRVVVIASKEGAESHIVGELYAVALQGVNVPIEEKMNLGATDIAHAALLKGGANGGIDLYPEYTSTGLQVVLQKDPIADPQKAYDEVKKGYKDQFKVTWLDKAPMNDTQAFATTITKSQELGLKTIQDLCDKAGEINLAARAEFRDRVDALPALQKIYGGCEFKDIKAVNAANLLYKALVDGEVEAAQADSTAGEIAGYNLVLLEDPKGYGGPYNIAPVVRNDVLANYPQMADMLNKISAKLTNEEISKLNWQVSGEGADPRDVAKRWLYEQELLKK